MNDPIAEEAAVVAEVELDEQPKPWIVSDEQVLADEQVRAIKHFRPTINVNFYKGEFSVVCPFFMYEDTTPRITSSVWLDWCLPSYNLLLSIACTEHSWKYELKSLILFKS